MHTLPPCRLVRLLGAALVPVYVSGHGAMLNPPPRNAIDSTIPGDDWGDGTNHTGIRRACGCAYSVLETSA
jgi:hypothetical protein